MVYGYIRISKDKQAVDSQRFEIERFCLKNKIKIGQWIEETISGTKQPEECLLGSLLARVKQNDLIICSELSRLGRSILMIMSILNQLMLNGVRVWTIKGNYRLGDDIQSKVLAFAFGLSAEIERDLVSQRTKEALALKRLKGVVLGRPFGKKSSQVKLSGHEDEILMLLKNRTSKSAIGRMFGVNRMTVYNFLKERIPKKKKISLKAKRP